MKLYIGNKNYSSWSLRPWLALREAGVPFEEIVVPFGDEAAWGPFRALSPSGKIPCLVDGDTVVWESLAIVEYVAEQFPALWPADRRARAWARACASEMHGGFGALRESCSMSVGIRARLTTRPPALERDLQRLSALFEDGLARFGGPWLAGPAFTAVDAFFAPVAYREQSYGLEFTPPGAAYLGGLRALPAMQAWEQAALAETWRDAPHDRETEAHATITADLRAR